MGTLTIRVPDEVKARISEAAWQGRTTVTELLLRPWMAAPKKMTADQNARKEATLPVGGQLGKAADPLDAIEDKPAPTVYPKADLV